MNFIPTLLSSSRCLRLQLLSGSRKLDPSQTQWRNEQPSCLNQGDLLSPQREGQSSAFNQHDSQHGSSSTYKPLPLQQRQKPAAPLACSVTTPSTVCPVCYDSFWHSQPSDYHCIHRGKDISSPLATTVSTEVRHGISRDQGQESRLSPQILNNHRISSRRKPRSWGGHFTQCDHQTNDSYDDH